MKCEEARASISAFLDMELAGVGQQAVFSHLSTCDTCRGFLTEALRVRETAEKEQIVVPEALDRRVFALTERPRVSKERSVQPSPWRRRRLSVPSSFAAGVAMAILVLAVVSGLALLRLGPWAPTGSSAAGASSTYPVVVVYQIPEEEVVAPRPDHPAAHSRHTIE
jgi:predicted anti-sigma-YlaC factor YlaD